MAEDSFLGRWSRRKLDVNAGKAVEAEPASAIPPPPPVIPAPSSVIPACPSVIPAQAGIHTPASQGTARSEAPAETSRLDSRLRGNDEGVGRNDEASPTLDDVQSLTPQSDFSRFVRADVPSEVRNAAVKKLFSDPHFNVMDGLDVYIDDYNKTEPLPPSMLRQLASAEFLGLFREEQKGEAPVAEPEAKEPQPPLPGAQDVAD